MVNPVTRCVAGTGRGGLAAGGSFRQIHSASRTWRPTGASAMVARSGFGGIGSARNMLNA